MSEKMQLLAVTFCMSQHLRLGDGSTVPTLSEDFLMLLFCRMCWECGKIRVAFSTMFPGPTEWTYANPQKDKDLHLIYNYFEIKATIREKKLKSCCQFPPDPNYRHLRINLCSLVHDTPHTAAGYIMEAVLKENNLPEWPPVHRWGWGKTIADIKERARHEKYIENLPDEEKQSTKMLTFMRRHIGGAAA